MTKVKTKQPQKTANTPPTFPLPIALLALGILLIFASFLPLGNWAAKSQWTPEHSAAYDQLCLEYKQSTYQSPARAGLSKAEHKAQRAKMKLKIDAFQQKLEQAKGQPKRWRRYLLGVGSLLTATGFFAHSARQP